MKRKVIICDICGKEISREDLGIKAKMKIPDSYANQDCYEFERWKRIDVCTVCVNKIRRTQKKGE